MSPSRLQVGVLVLCLKYWASRVIPSCRCPQVGLWWAASHDTHQVPSRRGGVGAPPPQETLSVWGTRRVAQGLESAVATVVRVILSSEQSNLSEPSVED